MTRILRCRFFDTVVDFTSTPTGLSVYACTIRFLSSFRADPKATYVPSALMAAPSSPPSALGTLYTGRDGARQPALNKGNGNGAQNGRTRRDSRSRSLTGKFPNMLLTSYVFLCIIQQCGGQ